MAEEQLDLDTSHALPAHQRGHGDSECPPAHGLRTSLPGVQTDLNAKSFADGVADFNLMHDRPKRSK